MKRRNKGIPATTADKYAVAEAARVASAIAACPPAEWQRLFAYRADAEAYLAARGFSVGRLQGPSERGILFGRYDIQKWRNLSAKDRAVLHGLMERTPVTACAVVTIFASAPAEAHAAIRSDPSGGE